MYFLFRGCFEFWHPNTALVTVLSKTEQAAVTEGRNQWVSVSTASLEMRSQTSMTQSSALNATTIAQCTGWPWQRRHKICLRWPTKRNGPEISAPLDTSATKRVEWWSLLFEPRQRHRHRCIDCYSSIVCVALYWIHCQPPGRLAPK